MNHHAFVHGLWKTENCIHLKKKFAGLLVNAN